MPDKFVLTRKRYVQGAGEQPKIRIDAEAYEVLACWAAQTGLPMSQLATRAVHYANQHLLFVDE